MCREPRIKGCVVRSRTGMPTAATSHTHKKVSWKLAPNRTCGFTIIRPSAAAPMALSIDFSR